MVNIDICKITSVMAPKYSVIIIPGEGGGGGQAALPFLTGMCAYKLKGTGPFFDSRE